jgi:solute carrier family 35, member F5
LDYWHSRFPDHRRTKFDRADETLVQGTSSDTHLLVDNDAEPLQLQEGRSYDISEQAEKILDIRDTAILSLEFCLLWFIANYFVAACLTYTSVASSTILTSTSSIWTLVFGALVQVEKFSFRKLIGVLASLAGIVLISSVDLSGDNDKNRGSFPYKSRQQIAIGDAMALFSAVMYGIYTIVMKKRIGNEDRVNMPLFFGLVGLFNVIFLWPGFLILHLTHVETFGIPPTGRIWAIVLVSLF